MGKGRGGWEGMGGERREWEEGEGRGWEGRLFSNQDYRKWHVPLLPEPPFCITAGIPPIQRTVSQLSHTSSDSTSKLVSRDKEVLELERRVQELESRLSLKDDEWKEVVAEREEELRRQWERRMMDVKAQLSTVCVGECVTYVCVCPGG